jgi:hypothetical protein
MPQHEPLPRGRPQRSYAPGEFFTTDAIADHALDFLADMRQSGARGCSTSGIITCSGYGEEIDPRETRTELRDPGLPYWKYEGKSVQSGGPMTIKGTSYEDIRKRPHGVDRRRPLK